MAVQVRDPTERSYPRDKSFKYCYGHVAIYHLVHLPPKAAQEDTEQGANIASGRVALSVFIPFQNVTLHIFFRKIVVFAEVLPVSAVLTDCWKLHHG